MKVLLREMSWEEVKELVSPNTVVILPTGSTEQHGPHLPLETDSRICEEVAVGAAKRVANQIKVVVAPTLCFGASSHHMAFPGTMSLTPQTFIEVVTQLCECFITHGFRKLLILNGHGGNHDPCKIAARNVMDHTGTSVAVASYWYLAADAFEKVENMEVDRVPGHAGGFETSCMLYLCPELVRKDRILQYQVEVRSSFLTTQLPKEPKVTLVRRRRSGELGLGGDPSLGSKDKGERYVEMAIQSLAEFLVHYTQN